MDAVPVLVRARPALRGGVTGALLLVCAGIQVMVLPTYETMLEAGGGALPRALQAALTAAPWVALAVLAAGILSVKRAPASTRREAAAAAQAVLDAALILWLTALTAAFVAVAVLIPKMGG